MNPPIQPKTSFPTGEESLFLRQNDYWIIRYHGHAALLKSTHGLRYLAVLLRDPGREFHVRELLARPIDASNPGAVAANGRVTGGLYGGVPVLDAQAKAECKCRVNDLRQDLDQGLRGRARGQRPQDFLERRTSAFCRDQVY